MNNIYADYLSIYDWNTYDTLATYERLFNELDIDITYYEDDFRSYNWEYSSLKETLNKILLYKAQDERIISKDIDIDECFDVYNEFNIISSKCENYEQIVKDLEDWCGIKPNVII